MIEAKFYGTKGTSEYALFLENYWEMIRQKRDELITKTDWTQAGDAPLNAEKKAEFAAYRQTLRDIPQSVDDPDNVVWPEKPAV